jgi:chromate transporter
VTVGPQTHEARLAELARVFLTLGVISFGGPAAHIALMRHECVERRHWLTDADFLDLVGATNLIPGPNSTEMAIHIGRLRAGWTGLIVAGACFLLPAVLIVWIVAALYVRGSGVPSIEALFYGVKPVVVAVIAIALWRLARTAVRSVWLALIAGVAVISVVVGVHELLVLAACGVVGGAARVRLPSAMPMLLAVARVPELSQAAIATAAITSGGLFLVFAKAGAFLFGSGYVLVAFLRADLVERLHWLTEQQLLDAVSVGQFTPGPVFTTATFIGYVLHGTSGALVATAAIFLPAFIYVALSGPIVPRLRSSAVAGGVLDGVNVASLALMAVVTCYIGRAAVIDGTTAALAVASAVAIRILRVNPAWRIAGGAGVGWAARFC